jgi:hypothetical protein
MKFGIRYIVNIHGNCKQIIVSKSEIAENLDRMKI